MSQKNNIIWLASYPKSGNTWFRAFLSALISEVELDINEMATNGIFSSKSTLESVLDLNADYLNPRQIEQFQRLTYTHLSAENTKPLFIKIHDAFTFSETDKLPLIPENATKMAIYLIRNPLDVTLSLANHVGKSIEKTIDKFIINPKGAFVKKYPSPNNQFHQPMGTWAMHVESWLTKPNFPVHFVRYEDLKSKPFETFKKAITAMGLAYSDEQIQKAIAATNFEKLKKLEQTTGFQEKQNPNSSFFNKGEVGRWKNELTAEQIEKICSVNEGMMLAQGYTLC